LNKPNPRHAIHMRKRAANQPIRVLVAEDSRSQRELLVGLLRAAGMDVAGTAEDGNLAVAEARRLRPDVIAMDIHMPGLDGYAATRQIMQSCPTPIVLISSASDASQRTVAALAAGALTVVRKPSGGGDLAGMSERADFLTTMRLMADVLVVTRRPEKLLSQSLELAAPPVQADSRSITSSARILAIAASTGGPAAVQMLLNGLGFNFPLPILIAQHIARGFVAPLAEWLSTTTRLPVRVAGPNELLLPGHVYLAPDDQHMSVFVREYAACRALQPADRYCPSADILFESVAAVYGRRAIGVILTGMGDDGARGLLALKAAGGRTLAQNESSCVVYGMPRVAVELGAVERVAALADLAQAVRDLSGIDGNNGTTI
jgi:two-component system, chemotaxis family, protein-glutamate methylesterase/glutaminase